MKKEIREKYIRIRNSLEKNKIYENSRFITKKVLDLDVFKKYENILIYSSIGSEVYTKEMINNLLKTKNVFLPKVISSGQMEFFKINSLNDLKIGKYNILEPRTKIKYEKQKSIVIVPGVAFSKSKYRIGYGGGYYDRFIKENKKNLYIGICFDEQITEFDKFEEYDQKMDIVITKSFVY